MSSKRLIIYGIVALCLLGLYLAGRHKTPSQPRPAAGNLAPDFTVTDLDGRSFSLSDYRGKVVLLNFWATWCAPCRSEVPHFVEMQEKYGPQGFQVIGISMDDDSKAVREFSQQYKLNYPMAMGSDRLAEHFGGVLGLPVNFIIDRQGRIHSKHLGVTSMDVFDQEVAALLAKP